MNPASLKTERVLAIDPFSRGFGFAVLEGPDRLIDWGVAQTRRNKRSQSLRRIGELLGRYRPAVLVVEDYANRSSRRCLRIRKLLRSVCELGSKKRVKPRRLPIRTVRETFSPSVRLTRHQIATVVATRFPELTPRLPKPRKLWQSEDPRIRIFGATALALSYFGQRSGQSLARANAARIAPLKPQH